MYKELLISDGCFTMDAGEMLLMPGFPQGFDVKSVDCPAAPRTFHERLTKPIQFFMFEDDFSRLYPIRFYPEQSAGAGPLELA